MENFITKVKINKVRHLKDIEIKLPEDKRTHLILTGRNGSGKTSVLEAIRLWIWSEIADIDTRQSLLFEYINDNPLKEQFKFNDDDIHIFGALEDKKEQLQNLSGVELSLKIDKDISDRNENGNYIVAYYSAEREYIINSEKFVENVQLKDSYKIYEKPGKDFTKYLINLKTRERLYREAKNIDKADKIQGWIVRLTDILRNIFNDSKLELYLDIEELKYKIKEDGKEPFKFDELSSGYSAIIDIVTDLMMRMEKNDGKNYDMEGVVLIDEVDAHLHIELQRKILPFLTELFPNIQFIVSTHSPYILTSISNAVIYDLEKKVQFNDMSGYAVDIVAEGYFNADNYSIKIKEMIKRFEELSEKVDITNEERAERAELRSKLEDVPGNLGLYIQSIIENIEWNGQIG